MKMRNKAESLNRSKNGFHSENHTENGPSSALSSSPQNLSKNPEKKRDLKHVFFS